LAVAVANGRFGVGIELNADYHELARQRLERTQLPLMMEALP
jgi:DNA modification methylase